VSSRTTSSTQLNVSKSEHGGKPIPFIHLVDGSKSGLANVSACASLITSVIVIT